MTKKLFCNRCEHWRCGESIFIRGQWYRLPSPLGYSSRHYDPPFCDIRLRVKEEYHPIDGKSYSLRGQKLYADQVMEKNENFDCLDFTPKTKSLTLDEARRVLSLPYFE